MSEGSSRPPWRARLFERFTSRSARHVALVLVTLVLLDQALRLVALADDRFQGRRVAPFDPPLFDAVQERLLASYVELLSAEGELFERHSSFDPDLGWCPRPDSKRGILAYDWAASRIGRGPLPRERAHRPHLIALVGDSFTRGDEVAAGESWAARLERPSAGRFVANFGVGGYGIDQAVLRARRDALPLAPDEVWLGLFPGSSLRVTSHFPPIQNHRERGIQFKPRFLLDEQGRLLLLPSPARTPADVPRLLGDQRALLAAIAAHDPWIRRLPAAYAPRGSSWTHYLASTRLALTWLDERDRSYELALADPESPVRRLHAALIADLAETARESGAAFRVLVLPGGLDLESRAQGGRAYWQELVDDLRGEGVEVVDPSDALTDAGGLAEPSLWMPNGHYSPRANEIIARVAAESWLR